MVNIWPQSLLNGLEDPALDAIPIYRWFERPQKLGLTNSYIKAWTMLTNFKMNRDDFNRMDGKSQEAMHGALRDWMSTAQEQRSILWRFAHLDEVLTVEDIPRVQNANLILRQIHQHVTELRDFFRLTPSKNVLDGAVDVLASSVADAEHFTQQIMKFVPEVMGTGTGKTF
jgi:hypothetical protein